MIQWKVTQMQCKPEALLSSLQLLYCCSINSGVSFLSFHPFIWKFLGAETICTQLPVCTHTLYPRIKLHIWICSNVLQWFYFCLFLLLDNALCMNICRNFIEFQLVRCDIEAKDERTFSFHESFYWYSSKDYRSPKPLAFSEFMVVYDYG